MKTIIRYLIVLTLIFYLSNGGNLFGQIISSKNEIKCESISKANENSQDSILINICYWLNYKFVVTGTPDSKGRYDYEYESFQISNDKLQKIKNSFIFNRKANLLLESINEILKENFIQCKKQIANRDCLQGINWKNFSIDDMGISFINNKIEFNVNLGLGSACKNVDSFTAQFNLDDIAEFVN